MSLDKGGQGGMLLASKVGEDRRHMCRGFVNRSAIGVGVRRFVEGGEHGRAIRDGCSMSLPSFRSRIDGEILRAAIDHYMATSARLQ
jgi:hypothetical protein